MCIPNRQKMYIFYIWYIWKIIKIDHVLTLILLSPSKICIMQIMVTLQLEINSKKITKKKDNALWSEEITVSAGTGPRWGGAGTPKAGSTHHPQHLSPPKLHCLTTSGFILWVSSCVHKWPRKTCV